MDFNVIVDTKNDYVVEKVELPNGKVIETNKNFLGYNDMIEFVGKEFLFIYDNGSTQKAKLISVGYTEGFEPYFTYDFLEERKANKIDE